MYVYSYEKALLLIENYIYHMRKPRRRLKGDLFLQRSRNIWAATEVLTFVQQHDYIPPLDAVNEFIHMMEQFSLYNMDTSLMFSTAKDVAEDIFDMLLTYL